MNLLQSRALSYKNPALGLTAGLWVLATVLGFSSLTRYSATPSEMGLVPTRWPQASGITRAATGDTLLLFAHPKCSCSEASLEELELLMRSAPDSITAQVIFFQPKDRSAQWSQTSLWRRASAIPRTTVVSDPDGREARRFRAVTSGTVCLYDARGALKFCGGITAARGMCGDNLGRRAVLAHLRMGDAEMRQTPAFGCPILTPN